MPSIDDDSQEPAPRPTGATLRILLRWAVGVLLVLAAGAPVAVLGSSAPNAPARTGIAAVSIDTSRLRVLDPLPARLPAEEASCNAADDERRGPPPRLDDPDEEATTAIGDGTAWPLIQSRAASAPYPAEPFVSAHWVVIAPPRAPPAAADQDCSRHPDAA